MPLRIRGAGQDDPPWFYLSVGDYFDSGREKRKGSNYGDKVCVICDERFTPSGPAQKTCSKKCQAARRKQRRSAEPVVAWAEPLLDIGPNPLDSPDPEVVGEGMVQLPCLCLLPEDSVTPCEHGSATRAGLAAMLAATEQAKADLIDEQKLRAVSR